MTPKERFRMLAILFGELVKIPEYDAEAARLYRRLRNGHEDALPQAQRRRKRRSVRDLRLAGLALL